MPVTVNQENHWVSKFAKSPKLPSGLGSWKDYKVREWELDLTIDGGEGAWSHTHKVTFYPEVDGIILWIRIVLQVGQGGSAPQCISYGWVDIYSVGDRVQMLLDLSIDQTLATSGVTDNWRRAEAYLHSLFFPIGEDDKIVMNMSGSNDHATENQHTNCKIWVGYVER